MLIYLITNTKNGKFYIGQTTCTPEKRWQEHVYNAQGNPFRKRYPLYNAIRKYGPESFTVCVLDSADSLDELNQKEIAFIAAYKTLDKKFGYNRHEGGNRPPKSTPESRRKAGLANQGQTRSLETRIRMSKAAKGNRNFLGRCHSEETKLLISQKNKDICAKRGGFRLGKKSSPEHIEKIRIANTGKRHSDATKAKISASKTNPSDETRANLRESHLGHKHSEETRKKMSESQKRRYV